MKVSCPECEAPIKAGQMNLDRMLATCSSCNALFSFADHVPVAQRVLSMERAEIGKPESVKIGSDGKGFALESSWFSLTLIPLVFFCIAWDSFLVSWYSMALTGKNTPLIAFVFPICHVAVGVGLTYFTVAGFLNTTTVRIERDLLKVTHGPLPWWGNREVPVFNLEQLFCEERLTNGKNGVSRSYAVMTLLKSGERIELLAGIGDQAKALFIEQQVESHLGIKDRPVAGELARS